MLDFFTFFKKYFNTTKLYVLHVDQVVKLRIKEFGVELCVVTKYDFFSSRGQKPNMMSPKWFCSQRAESHKHLLLLGFLSGQKSNVLSFGEVWLLSPETA